MSLYFLLKNYEDLHIFSAKKGSVFAIEYSMFENLMFCLLMMLLVLNNLTLHVKCNINGTFKKNGMFLLGKHSYFLQMNSICGLHSLGKHILRQKNIFLLLFTSRNNE